MTDRDRTKKKFPLVVKKQGAVVPVPQKPLSAEDPLRLYLKEISQYDLLSLEEEGELLKKLEETGDIEVAKKLVMANLRLVVKIAMEYRYSYSNIMDLIQEGNIGLMKAVSKYDAEKGAKLSYYASWWIRSYILKFILDNFRLVKVGTTSEQKKLFYNLTREKQRLLAMGIEPSAEKISKNLGVSERSVDQMEERIGDFSGELSLDSPAKDMDGASPLSEILSLPAPDIDESLANDEELNILKEKLGGFVDGLKPRDKDIFKKRLLLEAPLSLQAIADQYHVSRERIRQIEARLLHKLKVYMEKYLR